jgi:hypothetical protein
MARRLIAARATVTDVCRGRASGPTAGGVGFGLGSRLLAEVVRRPALVAWCAVGSVAAVGAVARLWHLNNVGLNSDEAVYSGQGAAIASVDRLEPFFRIFRAHPLLFQTVLSLAWRLHLGAGAGRWLAVALGFGTVFLTYQVGTLIYGHRTGVVAASFLLVMPYDVVVSRQILLDGPMAFFATAALYCLARFARDASGRWLYASSGLLGLAFLSKETTVLLLGAVYVFFVLSADIRLRMREIAVGSAILAGMIAIFPLALTLSGGGHTGRNYLAWQLLRRPNHSWSFYPVQVSEAVGLLVAAVALAGLVLLRHERSWRERLLICWIAVPFFLFELWPVKGFQYLLPVAPALAVLAARSVLRVPELRYPVIARWAAPVAAAAVCLTLAVPSWSRIQPPTTRTLAGAGGVPGGRATGNWFASHTSRGSAFFTIGPSMANIIEFYGLRHGYGLSVSPSPLARNPAYVPVRNPDLLLRRGVVRYLVWDIFSAQRSPYFARRLLRYVDRYDARVVHIARVSSGRGPGAVPVVVVYQVPTQPAAPHGRPLPTLPAVAAASTANQQTRRIVIYALYGSAALLAATLVLHAAAGGGTRRGRP